VDEAVVPESVAVVDVAPVEPLKEIVTVDPTGTFVPWTTTGIGSDSCEGNIKSILEKLDPEYEGTG